MFNDGRFELTDEFRRSLLASPRVFLVVLLSKDRAGTSTRGNQLIQGNVRADQPFRSNGGTRPVTTGIMFSGPYQFGDLFGGVAAQFANVPSNPDVFFLDCEGLDSDFDQTRGIRQAVIAAATIANMTILVTKVMSTQEIPFIRALLQWSKVSTGPIATFGRSMLIMQPDIGIDDDPDDTDADKNTKRKSQDVGTRDHLIPLLNKSTGVDKTGVLRNELNPPTDVVNETTLTVLCQPQLCDQDLYIESLKDAVKAMERVAKRCTMMSGEQVVAIFEGIAPILCDVRELDYPSRSLDTCFAQYVARCDRPVKHAKRGRALGLLTSAYTSLGAIALGVVCPPVGVAVVAVAAAGGGLTAIAHQRVKDREAERRQRVHDTGPDP
jgi:hypothetical protein